MKLKRQKRINFYRKRRNKSKNKKSKTLYKKNIYKKKFEKIKKVILLFILLYYYYYFIEYCDNSQKKIVIEVDITKGKKEGGGPHQLQRGLNTVLPYNTKQCKFIPKDGIDFLNMTKNVDYFFSTSPNINERIFRQLKKFNKTKSIILGPVFVPIFWFKFPNHYHWKERNFREILYAVKAVVVHTTRVRDFLAKRSGTTDLLNNFIMFRPCSFNLPRDIKSFRSRKIDFLLFEKYFDADHRKQGAKLYKLLNSTNRTIEVVKYGTFKRDYLLFLSSDSKFVIYFSFYDPGAIALKEIQNYGVINFSLQKDLVISNKTGYFIPELEDKDITPAFNKIMNIANSLYKNTPNSKKIARINQKISNCERALDDICDGILNKTK